MTERLALIVWWLAKLAFVVGILAAAGLLFSDLAIASPVVAAASVLAILIGRATAWILTGD